MCIEQQPRGLSAEDRQLIYARARMSQSAVRHAEGMVECSPARQPGKAALNNVVTRFNSLKNGRTHVLESHTCELVFAYELELDPTVAGYYVQAPCRHVERTLPSGRRHISSACLDFLVFRQERVELVECKPIDWLMAAVEADRDWRLDGTRWGHAAYEDFARRHELRFSVWSPPKQPGIYLQNLEALYATLRLGGNALRERVARDVSRQIATRPASVKELEAGVDGFDGRVALWMLATRQAFGPLKSTPIQAADFTLCADSEQATLFDELGLEVTGSAYAQPHISNPIILASATDLAKARERLARLRAIGRGELVPTVRMQQLARRVAAVEARGGNPLEACLTGYSRSGNRISRLLPEQQLAAEYVITRLWNTGRVRTQKNLYYAYQDECAAHGVPAGGKTALYERVRREKPTKRALATGGLRGYQAIRLATEPSKRSLPALGFGHTLFVDSSDLDNRSAPDLAKQMPSQKAKFYIGVDGATHLTMAHALVFGPARTDGLAILLREYVRRWGRLPHLIHWDRGPENRSDWTGTFAEAYQVSLRFSPTAGSAWNGLAEATIKRVNTHVSHELIGSTLPDQKGRKVDGRFKSYRNAKTTFKVIRSQFLKYIYGDLLHTPGSDGLSPVQRQEEARDLLGDYGFPCAYDEDFLLATSIPMTLKRNVDKRRGVRTEDGFFTSDQLLDALRFHDAEEVRSDCEDPTILRVRVAGAWIRAFHSKVQTMALLDPEDKLFDLMFGPIRRAQVRQRKEKIDRVRYNRIQQANFATVATAQAALKPPAEATRRQAHPSPLENNSAAPRAQWDELELFNQQENS